MLEPLNKLYVASYEIPWDKYDDWRTDEVVKYTWTGWTKS